MLKFVNATDGAYIQQSTIHSDHIYILQSLYIGVNLMLCACFSQYDVMRTREEKNIRDSYASWLVYPAIQRTYIKVYVR